MPQPDNFYIDLDEKAGKTTNWENVLNIQIMSINRLMTFNMPEFPTSVEAFKSCLVFFTDKDKKFKAELDNIESQARQAVEDTKGPDGRPNDNETERIAYARAKLTYEACLRAMGRAGFYPQRTVEFKE